MIRKPQSIARSREDLQLYLSPFVRATGSLVRNPVSEVSYSTGSQPGGALRTLEPGQALSREATRRLRPFLDTLCRDQWLFVDPQAMFHAYRLRYVSLETVTQCNQRCFFCPVSEFTRPSAEMEDGLLDDILAQIEVLPHLEGVFLNNYNEPFLDRRAGAIIARLHARGIKMAVNSNGTVPLNAVKPQLPHDSIYLLTFNFHTADRVKYQRERGRDHFDKAVRNIRQFVVSGVAKTTRIAVLGDMSDAHATETRAVKQIFTGLPVTCEMYKIMDRAGNLKANVSGAVNREMLWGCDQTGSRPLEHLHILPDGRCVLCCEDYYEKHVVGDLRKQSIHEVMSGDRLANYRKVIYGFGTPKHDFMCRHCEFSLPGEYLRSCGKSVATSTAL